MSVPNINLIPEDIQKSLYNKIAGEKLIHFFLLIALYLSILAFVIFFTKISINYETDRINQQIATLESEPLIKKMKDNQKKLELFNKLLKKIQPLNLEKSYALEHIKKLIEIAPDGITLKSLSVNQNKVEITGIANQRSTLRLFKQAIENRLEITDLDFPLSNLESPVNTSFTIRYNLKIL